MSPLITRTLPSVSTLQRAGVLAIVSLTAAGGLFGTWATSRMLFGDPAVVVEAEVAPPGETVDLAAGIVLTLAEEDEIQMGGTMTPLGFTFPTPEPPPIWTPPLPPDVAIPIPPIIDPGETQKIVEEVVSNVGIAASAAQIDVSFPWSYGATADQFTLSVSNDLQSWSDRSVQVLSPAAGGTGRGSIRLNANQLNFRFIRVIRTYKVYSTPIGTAT